jgi:hypothetical protein
MDYAAPLPRARPRLTLWLRRVSLAAGFLAMLPTLLFTVAYAITAADILLGAAFLSLAAGSILVLLGIGLHVVWAFQERRLALADKHPYRTRALVLTALLFLLDIALAAGCLMLQAFYVVRYAPLPSPP